jgi:hypothetical protein
VLLPRLVPKPRLLPPTDPAGTSECSAGRLAPLPRTVIPADPPMAEEGVGGHRPDAGMNARRSGSPHATSFRPIRRRFPSAGSGVRRGSHCHATLQSPRRISPAGFSRVQVSARVFTPGRCRNTGLDNDGGFAAANPYIRLSRCNPVWGWASTDHDLPLLLLHSDPWQPTSNIQHPPTVHPLQQRRIQR